MRTSLVLTISCSVVLRMPLRICRHQNPPNYINCFNIKSKKLRFLGGLELLSALVR